MTEIQPKRRWFRFSSETMIVLVTLASISIAWTTYQLRWIQKRHAFLEEYGAFISGLPHEAPWQLRLFGESGFEHETIMVPEEREQEAKELFPELQRIQTVRAE